MAGMPCAYPWRDGQAELTWVAGYENVSTTCNWHVDWRHTCRHCCCRSWQKHRTQELKMVLVTQWQHIDRQNIIVVHHSWQHHRLLDVLLLLLQMMMMMMMISSALIAFSVCWLLLYCQSSLLHCYKSQDRLVWLCIDQLHNLCKQYFWHTRWITYSVQFRISNWVRYKQCVHWHDKRPKNKLR